jgi:hypothetical protein
MPEQLKTEIAEALARAQGALDAAESEQAKFRETIKDDDRFWEQTAADLERVGVRI